MSDSTTFKKIEVGTILEYRWGYGQTNVDFFVCVKRTKASVQIIELEKTVYEAENPMSELVIPVLPMFFLFNRKIGMPKTKRIKNYYQNEECLSGDFGTIRIWDGRPLRATHYH